MSKPDDKGVDLYTHNGELFLIQTRVDKNVAKWVKNISKSEGLSVSAWLRRVLLTQRVVIEREVSIRKKMELRTNNKDLVLIQTRVENETAGWIQKMCESEGLSISAWLRRVLITQRKSIERELAAQPPKSAA